MGFSRGYHHPHTCHGMPSLRREIWQWTAAGLPNFGVVSWDGPWCHVSMWWWLARHFEVVVETITESSICMYIYICGIWKERKVPDPDEAIHGCHGEPSKVTVRMMRSPGHPMWTESEGIANDVPTQDSCKITFQQRQSKFFESILKLIPVFFSMDNPYTQVDSSSLQLQSWVVYIRYNPYPVSSCCWMAHSFHDAIRGRFWALHWFKDTY